MMYALDACDRLASHTLHDAAIHIALVSSLRDARLCFVLYKITLNVEFVFSSLEWILVGVVVP